MAYGDSDNELSIGKDKGYVGDRVGRFWRTL